MYCKLFTSLYQGTLRGRSDEILVFTNILAHCDRFGVSDIHPKSIAEEVGIPIERVQEALNSLEGTDPESRSPENDGRRISRLDEHRAWGWIVTNYQKYRAIKNEEDRREQNRIAQKKWRDKNKLPSSCVSIDNKESALLSASASASIPFNSDEFKKAWGLWEKHRVEIKKKLTPTSIDQQLRQLEQMGESRAIAAILFTIGKGWQGIREPDNAPNNGKPCNRANTEEDHATKGF